MNRYKCVVTDVQATAAAAAHPDGAYVKWTDHVAEVERLKARLVEAERDAERWRAFVKRSPFIAASCVAALDTARADGAGEGGK
jgi:hypothetical protein